MTTVTLKPYHSAEAAPLFGLASRIHEEVYAEPIFGGHPFFSEEAFQSRYEMALRQPGFELLVAHLDRDPVGYMYGYSITQELRWWDAVTWARETADELPADYTREDGARTVAIVELMVRTPFRRNGIARRLHDDYLSRRKEERAGLRVLPNNQPARAAYLGWGWSIVGTVIPAQEAPTYECMVKSLV